MKAKERWQDYLRRHPESAVEWRPKGQKLIRLSGLAHGIQPGAIDPPRAESVDRLLDKQCDPNAYAGEQRERSREIGVLAKQEAA